MITKPALLAALLVSALGASEANGQGTRQTRSAGEALRSIFTDGPITSPEGLIAVIQSQVTTFPLGSSAGGFTWGFDPQLGIQVRRSRSFGPMFADRPHTNGRRKLTVNLAFQRTAWKALAGENFDEGLVHWGVLSPEFGTLTNNAEGSFGLTKLAITTERTVIGASYGLTDRIDVGVVVPFGRTRVSGATDGTITDLQRNRLVIREVYPASGSSSGIGDLTIRGKVALLSRPTLSLAGGADVRLPTGSEEKMLGSGGPQTRMMLIGALARGNATPHFNVGYTVAPGLTTPGFGRRSRRPDELNYTVGADIVVSTHLTMAGDVIGRTLIDGSRVVRYTDATSSSLYEEPGDVYLLLGAIGGKVLIGNMWLVTASLVFPLNDNGLKPGVTPMIGFERAF